MMSEKEKKEKSLVIWKYAVTNLSRFAVSVPAGARILAVQKQRNQPQMWMLVDPEAPQEERMFRILGTGHWYPAEQVESWTYYGTFQTREGDFVWHLFEEVADASTE